MVKNQIKCNCLKKDKSYLPRSMNDPPFFKYPTCKCECDDCFTECRYTDRRDFPLSEPSYNPFDDIPDPDFDIRVRNYYIKHMKNDIIILRTQVRDLTKKINSSSS